MDWQVAFTEVEEMLVSLIPQRIAKLLIPAPIYCLMIEYYTSTVAGDMTPTLRLPTVAFRDRILAEKGDLAPYHLWSHAELPHCAEILSASIDDAPLLAKVRAHPNLVSRKMARKVAARLNAGNWTRIAPVADGFVVVAADASQSFGDTSGDIRASIGDARFADLQSRGLIGRQEWGRL